MKKTVLHFITTFAACLLAVALFATSCNGNSQNSNAKNGNSQNSNAKGSNSLNNNAKELSGNKLDSSLAGNKYYSDIMKELYANRELPANELMIKAAKLRLDAPYVANTLEREKEELFVDLEHTDCILFVESCLALVQTAKSADTSYAALCKNIQNLRYRNGEVDGYASRIHYTSEWILQAEKNGILKEMSGEIANTPLDQKFSFMTVNSDRYKHLKDNAENIAKVKEAEDYLNTHKYFYIPKDKIAECAHLIKDGDMVGFCTSAKGLDLSHVGIAYWDNGRLTFIHASMGFMKVTIEPKTLEEYANSGKSTLGIRIARIVEN